MLTSKYLKSISQRFLKIHIQHLLISEDFQSSMLSYRRLYSVQVKWSTMQNFVNYDRCREGQWRISIPQGTAKKRSEESYNWPLSLCGEVICLTRYVSKGHWKFPLINEKRKSNPPQENDLPPDYASSTSGINKIVINVFWNNHCKNKKNEIRKGSVKVFKQRQMNKNS